MADKNVPDAVEINELLLVSHFPLESQKIGKENRSNTIDEVINNIYKKV